MCYSQNATAVVVFSLCCQLFEMLMFPDCCSVIVDVDFICSRYWCPSHLSAFSFLAAAIAVSTSVIVVVVVIAVEFSFIYVCTQPSCSRCLCCSRLPGCSPTLFPSSFLLAFSSPESVRTLALDPWGDDLKGRPSRSCCEG